MRGKVEVKVLNLLSYSPWLVWATPILASLLLPLVAKIGDKARDYFSISMSFVTLGFAASMVPGIYLDTFEIPLGITAQWIPLLGIQLGVLVDPLSILFTNLIAFLGLVVLVYSLGYMAHEEGLTRYYSLMLLFIGSMIGLVIADNFLQMFIFWEAVGMCSYALVSFWYKRPEAVRAGVKVFMMTRIGDIALLAGIVLIYVNLGTLSYQEAFVQAGKIALPILTSISFLMLTGAVAKSAQLPIHTWLYGAMEAPTSVSCLLHGATMVKGGVYLIARTHVIFCGIPAWLTSVTWIGAITALIGATLALHTPDIKGVPAYSTISQIGFMFTALGVTSSPQASGWFASLFHLLSHAFFQGLGFLSIGSIVHQLGTRDMRRMGGLRRSMPITFALCLVVLLARSGIPPFCGFFSKGLIASSVWSKGDVALMIVIYVAIALTFAYTLRFIILTFLGEKSGYASEIHVHEAPFIMSVSSGVLAAWCLILGFLEPALIRFMHVGLVFDFSQLFSFESLVFTSALLVGGLPTYLVYQRKTLSTDVFRKGVLAPIDKTLEKGYFFDPIYEGVVVNCFVKLSDGFYRFVETAGLERLPYLVAGGAMRATQSTYKYLEVSLDRLCYLVAEGVAFHGRKIKGMHTGILPHFVLAAVLGFFFLCILLLFTVLW